MSFFVSMQPLTLHYSPHYNIGFFGLEKAHPFDTRKSARALEIVRQRIGRRKLGEQISRVEQQVSFADLQLVHTKEYLDSLTSSQAVARILEVPVVGRLPMWLVKSRLLRPMRLAVQGTIDAARSAMTTGLAINLAGGFHHASHNQGGGFCMYSDALVAVRVLQNNGVLAKSAAVLYVDLDAHQGNGVARACTHLGMNEVYIFDMYGKDIYPGDFLAAERIDLAAPLPSGTGDANYLQTLKNLLPQAIAGSRPSLAIYNAGTDILAGDPLGGLGVSANGVIERDRYVIETFRSHGIPLAIVPSGGYTSESHKLLAHMLLHALEIQT